MATTLVVCVILIPLVKIMAESCLIMWFGVDVLMVVLMWYNWI